MQSAVLATLVLSWLVTELPPERYAGLPSWGPRETAQERAQRYEDIADDIGAAVSEGAPAGQEKRLAAVLTAVAIKESGLAAGVDAPRCSDEWLRHRGCDGGRARTLWQLQGWRGETRLEAAAEALRRVLRSEQACRELPREARLAAYCAGTCGSMAGQRLSRDRMALAVKLLEHEPPRHPDGPTL